MRTFAVTPSLSLNLAELNSASPLSLSPRIRRNLLQKQPRFRSRLPRKWGDQPGRYVSCPFPSPRCSAKARADRPSSLLGVAVNTGFVTGTAALADVVEKGFHELINNNEQRESSSPISSSRFGAEQ